MLSMKILAFFLLFASELVQCQKQIGPEPWEVENFFQNPKKEFGDVPGASKGNEKVNCTSDYFFKRLLAILLNGGTSTRNKDGTRNIHLHFHLKEEQWLQLYDYSQKEVLCDQTFRTIIGSLSDGLYKPSFSEKVSLAWSEYVMFHLSQYKMELLWVLAGFTSLLSIKTYAKHVTKKIILSVLLITLYLYEAYVSFKDVEKKEHQKFVQALRSCQWMFWWSSCDVPLPDPLVILKHMHPGRILMRIITIAVTEPIIEVSKAVNSICDTIGDSIDIPIFGHFFISLLLKIVLNVTLICLIVMIFLTFVLNVPFKLSIIGGLVSLGTSQRQHILGSSGDQTTRQQANEQDKISGSNLRKFLDALTDRRPSRSIEQRNVKALKRSQSAGRIYDCGSSNRTCVSTNEGTVRKRVPVFQIGGGDA